MPEPIDEVPGTDLRVPEGTSTEDVLALLTHGELDIVGQLVDASNVTLLCTASLDGVAATVVHKPVAGERPLWDFPDGTLAERERATYVVSVATGWDLVPPTVLRDGPWGMGMAQLWMDVDESVDLVGLVHSPDPRLARMAVLDAVVNNADRKGGHVLPLADGRVMGVDHGVTFNVDDKLRTLLWQWAGSSLPGEALEVLDGLCGQLGPSLDGPLAADLGELLTRREVRRFQQRVLALRRESTYPLPSPDWPAVPWPPF